jgi:eukaryotic-like serine/threonine-protein kinase
VAFGPYIITRRIARGGMAEIYRARTRKNDTEATGRWVAVKMMRPSLGHEELRARLFQREARIASKMQHDNIVPVFAFGNEMDRPYIAMEYIRGRDLSHLLKNEKKGRDLIDYELGLYIGLLAAAGLGHAHRLVDDEVGPLGIVHRDISPGNVMIGYDGTVKVLDFGVARMNETQGVHTQTGTLRGKFAYMSPEQTLGEELDSRSDVFSLGTVLYELLTGINCFRAQNPIATLERVQQLRPVPPSRANRAITKNVDRVLARCLAKDKKRRFKDCRALEEAIGDFLDPKRADLKERMVALMEQEFSWEKHEEEQELTREEEEVAVFDVVDFALLADVGGLDAHNVKVAEEEEASQAEVKRRVVKKEEEDQEVFDEQPNAHEQPTSRISSEMPKPKEDGPQEIDDEDDATVAQPPMFEHTDERILAGELKVSSLFDRADEPSEPSYDRYSAVNSPGGAVDALLSKAAVPITRPTTEDGTAPPTIIPIAPPLPFYKKPIAAGLAVLVLVLVVAIAVTMGSQEAEPVVAQTQEELRPTTTLEPITLSLDEQPAKAEPKPHKRVQLPAIEKDPTPTPTPVAIAQPPPPPPVPEPPPPVQAPKKKKVAPPPPPPPAKPAGTGFLNVGARPWAQIIIDGKKWPYQTPQAGIELPAGKHSITLINDETGVTKTQSVTIKAGTYRTVMMDMRKK